MLYFIFTFRWRFSRLNKRSWSYQGISGSPPEVFTEITVDSFRPSSYLVANQYSISRTSDFLTFDLIVGNQLVSGYREGERDEARFGRISGIVSSQSTENIILVADYTNGCIRQINSRRKITSHAIGTCGEKATVDGTSRIARTESPASFIRHSLDLYYFVDSYGYSIRQLNIIGLHTSYSISTITTVSVEINSLAINLNMEIYFTHSTGVVRLTSEGTVTIIGNSAGHNDGKLSTAKVNEPQKIVFLSNTLFLLTDMANHVIRIVDLDISEISTICIPQLTGHDADINGFISQCRMSSPKYIVGDSSTNVLHIIGAKYIYDLSYQSKFARVFSDSLFVYVET